MIRSRRSLLLLPAILLLGGLVWTVQRPRPLPAAPDTPKNLIFLLVDTLREDTTRQVPTPALDRLAKQGQRVRHAWSPSTWTAASMIAIFTGSHVRQTGWDFPFGDQIEGGQVRYPPIPADMPVLAEVLRDQGFHTAGLYANPLMGTALDLQRGFERWDTVEDARAPAAVGQQLEGWDDGQRHFLYVHLWGAHGSLAPSMGSWLHHPVSRKWFPRGRPLSVPRALRGGEDGLTAYATTYQAVVRDVDHLVGQILDQIGPHASDTLIVLTSDHGELLGEHGLLGHSGGVWRSLHEVPLIVRGGRDPLPDTFPTAALASYLTDQLQVDHRWPVQWKNPGPLVSQREGTLAMSEDGRHKWLWDEAGAHAFDLAEDPGEQSPTVAGREAAELRATWGARIPERILVLLPGEEEAQTIEALEALGYIGEQR
ncbi:MAG: hypothetical protein ACI8S6_003402 [Myxococcota bacterium]|jgi:hypothetical protein